MATRKQRRRQQKLRRHDYEEVWVDDDGNEVEVDPATRSPRADPRASNGAARLSKPPTRRDPRGRPLREIKPPSWQRTFKRALIFFPIMYVVISLTSKSLSTPAQLLNALILALLLIPTMYFMDNMAYRSYVKRTRAPTPAEPRKKKG